MYDAPGLPPPGWYPDPERPGSQRWWNGTEWAAPTWVGAVASDALPEAGAMLGAAFRRTIRRWRSLAVLGVVAGAAPTVLTSIAFMRVVDGVGIVDEELVGWSNDRLPVVIGLFVAGAVIGWIGTIAVAWLAMREFDEEQAVGPDALPARSTGEEVDAALTALLRAGALLPRVILWMLLGAAVWAAWVAVIVGAFVASIALGVLVVLASIPVFFWLLGKLVFVGQAIVDRPGNPFARSWAVSRGRYWPVFGRVLLAAVISMIINYGASTIGSFAGTAQAGFGTTTIEVDERGDVEDVMFEDVLPFSPLTIGITAITAIVSAVFATATACFAFTELYRTRHPAVR